MESVRAGGGRARSSSRKAAFIAIVALLGLVLIATGVYLKNRGLGPRRLLSVASAVIDSRSVRRYSQGDYTNIVFLHHSVGEGLIDNGGLREALRAEGYYLWDHGYNREGLRRPDGNGAGYAYNVLWDNTDPDGLAVLFAQPVFDLPINAISALLQHEVIVFKSCFPASNITSDEQVGQYKAYYLRMRDLMDRHPDKLFILLTTPPLNPAETTPDAARRTRAMADWIMSEEYLGNRSNIRVFDLFGLLAENDLASSEYGMLRLAYRAGADSHPNRLAGQTVAPLLAGFVVRTIADYRSTGMVQAAHD